MRSGFKEEHESLSTKGTGGVLLFGRSQVSLVFSVRCQPLSAFCRYPQDDGGRDEAG